MVIFNSFVKLPEGKQDLDMNHPQRLFRNSHNNYIDLRRINRTNHNYWKL